MSGFLKVAMGSEVPSDREVFAYMCAYTLSLMGREPVEQELVELATNSLALEVWMHKKLCVPDMGIGNVDESIEPEIANYPPSGLGDGRLGQGEGRLPSDGGAKILHASWQPVWIDAVSDRDDLGVVSVSDGADGDHAFGLVVRSPGRF